MTGDKNEVTPAIISSGIESIVAATTFRVLLSDSMKVFQQEQVTNFAIIIGQGLIGVSKLLKDSHEEYKLRSRQYEDSLQTGSHNEQLIGKNRVEEALLAHSREFNKDRDRKESSFWLLAYACYVTSNTVRNYFCKHKERKKGILSRSLFTILPGVVVGLVGGCFYKITGNRKEYTSIKYGCITGLISSLSVVILEEIRGK